MTTGDGRGARAVAIRDERDIDAALAALGVRAGPAVLLIGGASNIEADEVDRLERFFARAFVPAVGRLGAVVLTGGTDEGVMRFVGSANIRVDRPVRLVGVAPYAKVAAPGSTGTTPLARGHAEFVLVPGDDWGDESAILRALASKLSGGTALIVLVNGGEVASDEAARGIASGNRLVIVEGSGRAADELVHDLRRGGEGLPDHDAVTDTVAPVIVDVDVTAADLEAVLGGILGGASVG